MTTANPDLGGQGESSPLGYRIRMECARRNWDLGELAHRAGVARTTLYHLVNSHTSRPRATTLGKISNALRISPEYLLDGDGDRPAPAPIAPAPALFFSEHWKQTPANDEHPVTQQSIANPSLELKLYGTTSKEIQLTGALNNENNPIHVWTGMCSTPCALAFRHKDSYADLTGLARIRWNTKTSGFHQIRPIVKLADGTWLVGDRTDGTTRDWLSTEFNVADVRWLKLDIERVVTTGNIVERPDLSKVDEIGFVDLIPGSGHGAGGWSDVAQVDVFATSVARTGSTR